MVKFASEARKNQKIFSGLIKKEGIIMENEYAKFIGLNCIEECGNKFGEDDDDDSEWVVRAADSYSSPLPKPLTKYIIDDLTITCESCRKRPLDKPNPHSMRRQEISMKKVQDLLNLIIRCGDANKYLGDDHTPNIYLLQSWAAEELDDYIEKRIRYLKRYDDHSSKFID